MKVWETDYVGKPVKEGDRVIFAPGTNYGAYGFQWNPDEAPHFRGGFADYMYLNYPNTCFMKTDASPEVAVLTEPFTVGVHAAMRGEIKLGDTVVVAGFRGYRTRDACMREIERCCEGNYGGRTRRTIGTRETARCRCNN